MIDMCKIKKIKENRTILTKSEISRHERRSAFCWWFRKIHMEWSEIIVSKKIDLTFVSKNQIDIAKWISSRGNVEFL